MPNDHQATLPLDPAAVTRLIDEHFPQVHEGSGRLLVEALPPMAAVVRMLSDQRMVRPGGTVSGPAMFKLADFAFYVALLGHMGPAVLQAVTTTMTMNFLSRPAPGDLIARVRLLKVGRRIAVAEAELYSDGQTTMVAHATGSYALPPQNMR